MDISFSDYLEARFALDERSLNPEVRRACFEGLSGNNFLYCLDVGTGTGAMVRRLLDSGLRASLAITALDRDPGLLRIACATTATQLARRGFRVRSKGSRIDAEHMSRRISVEFQCCGLLEFAPAKRVGYDLITAHNFMDLVPMARALSLFSGWLAEGGLLYATLNYDGDTALFPLYRDQALETAVLAEYDASMERRRARGEPAGGARAGRRLHALLGPAGFDVVVYGSSDWNITPQQGRYRDRDQGVLCALLNMIRGEGERQSGIDRDRLARWYAERWAQLETGQLGMIIHQLDMLATRRQGFTALT